MKARGVFIINTYVKDEVRVRLGCEERIDLCERSRAEILFSLLGDGCVSAREFLCYLLMIYH